ncbi:PREDICTED: pancreatic triacylglycerol lipase-like isoform X2 [Branchiostoma belcheri]|uniref:Pancreatic triacylglycerol lipase-like isoform X2 n=1 Tax=Branchiostoma belcheri TaxID=7741 RepID=A0A6P4ZB03_BRABE|nr:PREDICTED: pancreatic triacylglycerol lipase-like isoform X2 [Branchiostoma belcheri]
MMAAFFLLQTLFVMTSVLTTIRGADVCYGDLGCFTTDYPWSGSLQRPIASLPRAPEELQIKFILRTRGGPADGQIVRPGDRTSLLASNFDGRRPTKFISHGFIENGFVSWITDMSQAFLRAEDCNVFGVDWGSGGGSMLPYTQATANTQLVGATIAQFINLLMQETGASLNSFHLVGHSLGSHIMGYAGERLPGVGRITGLDPAEPYFQGTDPIVRLDPTDAQLVDVIHSDGGFFFTSLGLGMYDPVGHLDFYPNGGIEMPGCDQGLFDFIALNGGIYEGGREFVACNHLKAIEYFDDSIGTTCPMMGYPCRDNDRFQDGHCMDCGSQGCAQMGYHADRYAPPAGVTNLKYYLNTAERSPHCVYHYQIKLTLGTSSSADDMDGTPEISIITESGSNTGYHSMTSGSIRLQAGNTYQYLLTSPSDFGTIREVRFRWDYNWSLLNPGSWPVWFTPKIWVDKVQVVSGESQQRRTFCGFNSELTENVVMGLPSC